MDCEVSSGSDMVEHMFEQKCGGAFVFANAKTKDKESHHHIKERQTEAVSIIDYFILIIFKSLKVI